jgi:hypothetical protein
MKRYLVVPIHQDLKEKMVFLGDPRQVGKTTLALLQGSTYPIIFKYTWAIKILNWPPPTPG